MFPSASATPVIFISVLISILQFQYSLSAPAKTSSQGFNLISHLDTETGISFPKEVANRCQLSSCNIASAAIKYICGSDGKSYKNIQELECTRRSCKTDLRLKSQGECPARSEDVKENTSFREKKLYVPVVVSEAVSCHPDQCGCTDEFVPICGSDGMTYGNKCLLQCNQKCNPEVREYHVGYCGRIFFKDSLSLGKAFQIASKRQQPIVYTQLL